MNLELQNIDLPSGSYRFREFSSLPIVKNFQRHAIVRKIIVSSDEAAYPIKKQQPSTTDSPNPKAGKTVHNKHPRGITDTCQSQTSQNYLRTVRFNKLNFLQSTRVP